MSTNINKYVIGMYKNNCLFITPKDFFVFLNPSRFWMRFRRQWCWCAAHHTAQITINHETGWSSLAPHLLSHLHAFGSKVKSAVVATGHTTKNSISAPPHRWERNRNTHFLTLTHSLFSITPSFHCSWQKSIFRFTLTSINSIYSIALSQSPRCSFLNPYNLSKYSREMKKCFLVLKMYSEQDFSLTLGQWKPCSFIKKKKETLFDSPGTITFLQSFLIACKSVNSSLMHQFE